MSTQRPMSTHLLNLAATGLLLVCGVSSLFYALMVPDQEKLDRITEAAALTGAAHLSHDGNTQSEAVSKARQVTMDGGLDVGSARIVVGHWDDKTETFMSDTNEPTNALQVTSESLSFSPAFSQIAIRFDVVNLESTSIALLGDSSPSVVEPAPL